MTVSTIQRRAATMIDMSIKTERIVITPDMALAFLDQNKINRNLTVGTVAKYARDMKDGRWRFTGDPIQFDTNRNLINGQHRLTAVVKADVPVEFLVIYNLPPVARDVIDIGKSRSVKDHLHMTGVANAQRMASVARQLMMHKIKHASGNMMFSSPELLACIERHPKMQRSCGLYPGRVSRHLPASAIMMTHYAGSVLLDKHNEADAMYQVFRTGVPAYNGDPMHLLREKFLATTGATRVTPRVAMFTLFATWNAFSVGRSLKRVDWWREPVQIAGLTPDMI